MYSNETGEIRKQDDVKRSFLVTLEREVTVRQFQVVNIEVEGASEEEAERRAIVAVEDEAFMDEEWEVVECEFPPHILVPPSAGSIEPLHHGGDGQ